MAALCGEAAVLIPGYDPNSPAVPSNIDRLISGYRLIWGYPLIDGPCNWVVKYVGLVLRF